MSAAIDFQRLDTIQDSRCQYPFPAQVEDAKAAVRWLAANSAQYNRDINRIGARGWSGGDHMALKLDLSDPMDGIEGAIG
jgi:dienelactone hydrolase